MPLEYEDSILYEGDIFASNRLEDQINDASYHLRHLMQELYGKDELSIEYVDECLDLMCKALKVDFTYKELPNLQRRRKVQDPLQEWMQFNSEYLSKLKQVNQ